jgi:hypothetical protein
VVPGRSRTLLWWTNYDDFSNFVQIEEQICFGMALTQLYAESAP